MNNDSSSITGSTNHLVGITPKRIRRWQNLYKNRTSLEKKLIFLFCITLIALICLAVNSIYLSGKKICYTSMLLDNMDLRENPCDDFYKYACGRWSENHFSQSDSNSWFSDRSKYLTSKMSASTGYIIVLEKQPNIDSRSKMDVIEPLEMATPQPAETSSSCEIHYHHDQHFHYGTQTHDHEDHHNHWRHDYHNHEDEQYQLRHEYHNHEDEQYHLRHDNHQHTANHYHWRHDYHNHQDKREQMNVPSKQKHAADQQQPSNKKIRSDSSGILSENSTSEDPKSLVDAKSLFASCIDTDKLDELGLQPILDVFKTCGLPTILPNEETATKFSIGSVLAKIQRTLSMDLLVQLSIAVDPATNLTIPMISPAFGGSSLPELVTTEEHVSVTPKEVLTLRLAYISGVLSIIDPTANFTELGTAALKILLTDSQLKTDIRKSYSEAPAIKMTFNEIQELMDNVNSTGGYGILKLDWADMLNDLMDGLDNKLTMNDSVMVENKNYFVALALRLHKSKPETFQRYLWWSLLTAMVPHSTSELRSLKDDLYEALFKRPNPTRIYKCVKYVKTFFNMAISYKFSKMDDIKRTTEKVSAMLEDIIFSFNKLVNSLSWMDSRTKTNARNKAKAVKSNIGYPDWLLEQEKLAKHYENIEVIDGEFLKSMVGIQQAEVKKVLLTLGKGETKKYSWVTDPLEVNAFYGRESNAITIPAGILQSPFYYLGLEAMNYGAIGSILGHELTHAFDIEGKNYDANGRRTSWWDEKMSKEYDERATCFVNQYNNYGYSTDDKINGSLTLAENIADNGGLREAFHAYELFKERNGVELNLPGLEGYTHEQLFFLAFANVWCEKTSPGDEAESLLDVHSPNKFRVFGTLTNLESFSRVWECPVGSKMNPRNKCVLW